MSTLRERVNLSADYYVTAESNTELAVANWRNDVVHVCESDSAPDGHVDLAGEIEWGIKLDTDWVASALVAGHMRRPE